MNIVIKNSNNNILLKKKEKGACCNLKIFLRNKILIRSYLIYLTKTFGSINKIFSKVEKTIQANEFG